MKSKKEQMGVWVTPTSSLQILRGDLAVMDMEMFLSEYKCSAKEYYRLMEQFGAEDLIDSPNNKTSSVFL